MLSVVIGGGVLALAAELACGGDPASTAELDRPAGDELREFYREVCAHLAACGLDSGAGGVDDCAEFYLDTYEDLSTTCLRAVNDYYECLVAVEDCDKLDDIPHQGGVCWDLRHEVHSAGGPCDAEYVRL